MNNHKFVAGTGVGMCLLCDQGPSDPLHHPPHMKDQSPYITVFADEDGVIWAQGMVDGETSDRFDTVNLPSEVQDENILKAVRQVLVKIAE